MSTPHSRPHTGSEDLVRLHALHAGLLGPPAASSPSSASPDDDLSFLDDEGGVDIAAPAFGVPASAAMITRSKFVSYFNIPCFFKHFCINLFWPFSTPIMYCFGGAGGVRQYRLGLASISPGTHCIRDRTPVGLLVDTNNLGFWVYNAAAVMIIYGVLPGYQPLSKMIRSIFVALTFTVNATAVLRVMAIATKHAYMSVHDRRRVKNRSATPEEMNNHNILTWITPSVQHLKSEIRVAAVVANADPREHLYEERMLGAAGNTHGETKAGQTRTAAGKAGTNGQGCPDSLTCAGVSVGSVQGRFPTTADDDDDDDPNMFTFKCNPRVGAWLDRSGHTIGGVGAFDVTTTTTNTFTGDGGGGGGGGGGSGGHEHGLDIVGGDDDDGRHLSHGGRKVMHNLLRAVCPELAEDVDPSEVQGTAIVAGLWLRSADKCVVPGFSLFGKWDGRKLIKLGWCTSGLTAVIFLAMTTSVTLPPGTCSALNNNRRTAPDNYCTPT